MESKVLAILEELHSAEEAQNPRIRAALDRTALMMMVELGQEAQKELDEMTVPQAPLPETF